MAQRGQQDAAGSASQSSQKVVPPVVTVGVGAPTANSNTIGQEGVDPKQLTMHSCLAKLMATLKAEEAPETKVEPVAVTPDLPQPKSVTPAPDATLVAALIAAQTLASQSSQASDPNNEVFMQAIKAGLTHLNPITSGKSEPVVQNTAGQQQLPDGQKEGDKTAEGGEPAEEPLDVRIGAGFSVLAFFAGKKT